MPSFTDADNRSWTIPDVLHVGHVRRVLEHAKFSIPDIVFGGKQLGELWDNPLLIADVVWAIVEPEAKSRQINKATFDGAFYGNVIADAYAALLEALPGFFPDPRRSAMRALVTIVRDEFLTTKTTEKESPNNETTTNTDPTTDDVSGA